MRDPPRGGRAHSLRRALWVLLAAGAGWSVLLLAGPPPGLVPEWSDRGPVPARAIAGTEPADLGGWYFCPLGERYSAYAGLFYPPNHPQPFPMSVRPDRCFSTADDAEAAGYSLAPSPAGTVELEGIYLGPADPVLLRRCRAAASRLGFSVPCPGLLPLPGYGEDPRICGDFPDVSRAGCVYSGRFLLSVTHFAVPPDYGQPGGTAHGTHLVITAFRPRDLLDLGDLRNRSSEFHCPAARIDGTVQVGGTAGLLVVCGEGSSPATTLVDAGHVILRWSWRGVTNQVSVHGDNAVNRRLARLVAGALTFIGPDGPCGEVRPPTGVVRCGPGSPVPDSR